MDQEMDMRNITAVNNLNEEQKTKSSDEIIIVKPGFLDRKP